MRVCVTCRANTFHEHLNMSGRPRRRCRPPVCGVDGYMSVCLKKKYFGAYQTLVIISGNGKIPLNIINGSLNDNIIELNGGCSIAVFDYRRVPIQEAAPLLRCFINPHLTEK